MFLQPIELRLAAATAVAKMGDTGGVYVADSALSSPDPAVRAQACFLYAAAAEVRDWIEEALQEPLPSEDLLDALKDGVALCK